MTPRNRRNDQSEMEAPAERFMLTGPMQNFDYRGQIAQAHRSAKARKNVEARVALITTTFEHEYRALDGETTFQKAESLAKLATAGL